ASPAASPGARPAGPRAPRRRPSGPRRRGSPRDARAPAAARRRSCDLALVAGREDLPALAQLGEQPAHAFEPLGLAIDVRVVELALAEEVDRPQPDRDLAVAHVEREQQLVEDRLGTAHPVAGALAVADPHRRARLGEEADRT